MEGVIGITPPEWVVILEAAHDWGVPPWCVEMECSQTWWERYLIYRAAQGQVRERAKRNERR